MLVNLTLAQFKLT